MAAAMPRRPLGQTGLSVSILGYGASGLGGVFEPIDEAHGIESVHHAFRQGVNFFDTSPFYGATKSEQVLGRALRDLPRSEVVVATKVGRYGPAAADFDFSAARVTASVSESLQRLQVPYIDLIQCHDIEFGDLDQIVGETLPALQRLKAQGLVRHIGITGLPLGALTYVLERAPPGTVDTVLSYCHYCLNDTSLQGALPALHSRGVGVINASPLAMGLLTRQGPPGWHPAPPALRAAAVEAVRRSDARGVDIAKLGVAFALRNSHVCSTFVGMYTTAMVDANVRTALEAQGLVAEDAAVKEAEEAALAEVLQVLAPVKDLTWPSGKWTEAGGNGQ